MNENKILKGYNYSIITDDYEEILVDTTYLGHHIFFFF